MLTRRRPYPRSSPPKRFTERVGRNPDTGAGGFKGMRTTMSGSQDKSFAEWLHNCYSADPINGGEIVARPGRQNFPGVGNSQVGPLDSTTRACQLYVAYAPPTVSPKQVAMVGAKFYANSPAFGSGWFEAVNAATFTAAGITLTVADHYAVSFNGKLVVCSPTYAFTWDGTTNGGITKLTNAGTSFYGRPTVYAGKLFFIRANRKTIVWSEEGDATLGYEAGGYSNAWDLIQTSTEQLTVILGTNEALYYFRKSAIGAIYGGSNADFRNSSTLDSVSSTEGTDFPDGVCLAHDTIWFMDNNGRPKYFHTGAGEIAPAWTEIERGFTPYVADGLGYDFLAAPNTEQASFVTFGNLGQATYLRSLDLVCFSYRYFQSPAISSAFDVLVCFHAETKTCQTVWSFPTAFTRVAEHLSGSTGVYALGMVDQYGYVYSIDPSYLGSFPPRSLNWFTDKDNRFVDRDVQASVIGPRHFEAQGTELRTIRLDLEYVGGLAGALMQLSFATPNVMQAHGVRFDRSQPMVLTLEGNAATPGQQTAPLNAQLAVGLNELGRWIAFGFAWGHQTSQARILGWQVTAVADNQHPRAA